MPELPRPTVDDFRQVIEPIAPLPPLRGLDLTQTRRNIDDAFDDFGNGGGGGGRGATAPIDEEQEQEHPFAIKVKVASFAGNGDWATATVKVISGSYKTFGGAAHNANGIAFPAEAVSQLVTRDANGSYTGYVYLYIPLEAHAGGVSVANSSTKVRAIAGGQVRLRKTIAAEWPNIVRIGGGVGTAVRIGTWTIKRLNISPGGIPTYILRIQPEQTISDNIVLGDPAENDDVVSEGARTFFVTAGTGANVNISPGAINSVACSTTSLAVSNGQSVYIKETVNGSGTTTAVVCEAGAGVPANTVTEGHQLLATVAVAGDVVTVTPLGWDFSNARVCGTPGVSTQHDFW